MELFHVPPMTTHQNGFDILVWLEQGKEHLPADTFRSVRVSVLSYLEEERLAAEQRAARIREVLGSRDETHSKARVFTSSSTVSEETSIPDLVIHVLRDAPNGLRAADILDAIKQIRDDASEDNLRTALYRGTKGGRIAPLGKRGTRGKFVYYLKENA